MPKIEKILSLEITPERFVKACSNIELQELDILIQSEMRSRALKEEEWQKQNTAKDTRRLT